MKEAGILRNCIDQLIAERTKAGGNADEHEDVLKYMLKASQEENGVSTLKKSHLKG